MTAPTLTMGGLRDRVAAGTAWLDLHDPGWWRADQPGRGDEGRPIDLDELSMRHPCYCVLGHRWGNYYSAPISVDQAVGYGFDTASGAAMDVHRYNSSDEYAAAVQAAMDEEFTALTALWRSVVEQRRAGVSRG